MPIVEDAKPRFYVVCDRCGESMGSEDYGGYVLYESEQDAADNIDGWQWRYDEAGVVCEACLDEEKLAAEEAAAVSPADTDTGQDG